MDLKRNITDVSDVKRGATNINYIYRATTLVWQRSTPVISGNIVNFNTKFSFNTLTTNESKYSTTFTLLQ